MQSNPIMSRPFSVLALVICFCSLLASSGSDVGSYAAWEDVSWAIWDVKLSSLLGEDKQTLYDDHIARCREAAGSTDRADAHCYVDEYVSEKRQRNRLFTQTNKSSLTLQLSFCHSSITAPHAIKYVSASISVQLHGAGLQKIEGTRKVV